ncbi:major facilitator superfamily protein [Listeria fleischmannii 1991]|uniref:Major facilitator superfamily protein n=2 Tax=Listeria fleischmannii TaxID=1069827 RepID=A0A0J8GIX2_9LIST|nr:cysteine hydrolase [Listeria fleischmannii]KMT60683.1 major facilitator superfamily protein [Listeria fleischmannii 1991]
MTDLTKKQFDNAALVVIDLQAGIFNYGGPEGLSPYSIEEVVKRNEALGKAFLKQNLPVVLITVSRSQFSKEEEVAFTALVPELEALTGDDKVEQFTKYEPSAMSSDALRKWLAAEGIQTIFLTGVITSLGVAKTAIDAHEAGFNLVIAADAMSSRTKEDHDEYVEKHFPNYATLTTTNEILNLL